MSDQRSPSEASLADAATASMSARSTAEERSEKDEWNEETEAGCSGLAASLLMVPIRRRKKSVVVAVAPPPIWNSASFINYWDWLRRNRRFPSLADVDGQAVAAKAGDGKVMTCRIDGRHIVIERVFGSPSSKAVGSDGSPISGLHSAMVLEWLRSLGQKAMRVGAPVEEQETFTSDRGQIECHAVILPLSADQLEVDHLLCCLRTRTA